MTKTLKPTVQPSKPAQTVNGGQLLLCTNENGEASPCASSGDWQRQPAAPKTYFRPDVDRKLVAE